MTGNPYDPVRIGIVSISDRASSGVYEDKGLPHCRNGCSAPCATPSISSLGSSPTNRQPSAPL